MICPSCHAENLDDSRFCSRCGMPLNVNQTIRSSATKTVATPLREVTKGSLIAGKYRVMEELGRGGMGIVYKAEDLRLKRTVALKFLPPELADNPELRERFLVEAQAAAALSHPNICVIHEVGEDKDRPFIAMEYVEGETVRDKVQRKAFTPEEALSVTSQVAAGLGEAHHKNIIHRDIKSGNIMITAKGQAKIMDFGLAKLRSGSSLTRSRTTLGTVGYMSTEQAQGQEVDGRTDLWSLGVVFYEMLTGKLPFRGDRDLSVIHSIVHEDPASFKVHKPQVPSELQKIIFRALKKKRNARYHTAEEMLMDLRKYEEALRAEEAGIFSLHTLKKRLSRPAVAVSTVLTIITIAAAAFWFFNRQAKISWAKNELLPEIDRLVEESFMEYAEPYRLAQEAEKVIPHNPKLIELFSKCSLKSDVITDPPGANVYVKGYETPEKEWEYLGVSPLEEIRLPIGFFRWKIEKDGYETVLAASANWDIIYAKAQFIPNDLIRVMDKKKSIPEGMVRVLGAKTPLGTVDDFFIDQHEVTNKQYKEFIDSGGYQNREYWKHEFVKEGKVLTWNEAMAEFTDQTKRPGPSTWMAGDYPEGQADYPVSGISWHEAAAYAEFVGKSLPTGIHWGLARGEQTPTITWFPLGGNAVFAPLSNFQGEGPEPVGQFQGITTYGAFDMAGNVREWCWNKTPKGRLIRGGAWNDIPYFFGIKSQASSFDRSIKNGFRCAVYPVPDKIPEAVFQLLEISPKKDFYSEKPVSDEIFKIYKEQFSYDHTDLDAKLEWKNTDHEDWIQEQVSFDAAYGNERMIAMLFFPKNTSPPYQTVIYVPGKMAFSRKSCREIENSFEFRIYLSFVLKNGRAVVYPVYKGMMERYIDPPKPNTHRGSEHRIQIVKDFRRCFDYLESREDIDSEKIAYYGLSWGGAWPGQLIPAIENRLKVNIIMAGGLTDTGRPEVHPINYVSRITIPTLILSGKYDSLARYETSSKPLYDLLGTQPKHKEQKLYNTDHVPPRNEFIKEILSWLDKYLGPVRR